MKKSETRSATVIAKWATMTPEERAARSESLRQKKKVYWASLTQEQIEDFKLRTAEGRRKSAHWNGALSLSIPAGKYRAAGLSEVEIAYLMTLTGPERKAARLRMRDYGLTPTQYRDMLSAQGGRCGLCLEIFDGKIHVDHDHRTHVIRGLLCTRCNLALGHLEGRGRDWAMRAFTWIEATSAPSGD